MTHFWFCVLIWLQPVVLCLFRHKLAGLKSLTNHRIPSSELLFTSQRELLNHMGMFKKKSPCDVECVYLALLSRLAFICFMWWFSCWERKCSDTDCLSTACLWLQGNLSLNMLNTRNPIPPGLISYWCNCCMPSYEDVQASKVPSCPLSGLVGFSDGRPCGTLPSLHSQWPLGSRSHLLLKLFSKLFRFFSSPESPGSLGWIPENLELSRDFLCLWDLQQAVVSPHSTEFNTDGLRSPQSISREDGRCSELHFRCQKGLKTSICWIFYSLFPLKKPLKCRFHSSIRTISGYFRTRP